MATVSLLAIGNEVADGQITNRNGAWLAQELVKLGFVIDKHLTVKDGLSPISEALNYLSKTSDLIITIGGLGPTVDDCTRQALAQFLEVDLQFNQDQWDIIQNLLNSRNVTIRAEHKKQAYSPKGSVNLPNSHGVAPGFFNQQKGIAIAALPGPPRELKGIWQEHLKALIVQKLKPRREQVLKTWICFGAAESEIQHHVADMFSQASLEYGFRLHRPYVELKAWVKAHEESQWQDFFNKVEAKLGNWYVGPTIEQVRSPFISKLTDKTSIQILDGLTEGLFLEKIKEAGASTANLRYYIEPSLSKTASPPSMSLLTESQDDYRLILMPENESTARFELNGKIEKITPFRNIPLTTQLGKMVVVETIFARGL